MILIFIGAVLLITGLLNWRIALLSVLLACTVQYLPSLWAPNQHEIIMWSSISLPFLYAVSFAMLFIFYLLVKYVFKRIRLRILIAWAALRAGRVFPADAISVIASCQEDTDIIGEALKLLKVHPENHKWYQLVTENISMILLSRNRHLPPFCVLHRKKQLVLRRDFLTECPPVIRASMLINYAVLLRKHLKPYSACAIDEQLRFLADQDSALCPSMMEYYRQLGHEFSAVKQKSET